MNESSSNERKERRKTNIALQATQVLFYLLSGLGFFFVGVGMLWFVSVYKEKNQK
jgi:hypothetical protein